MRLGIRATTFIMIKSVLVLLSVPNGSQPSHRNLSRPLTIESAAGSEGLGTFLSSPGDKDTQNATELCIASYQASGHAIGTSQALGHSPCYLVLAEASIGCLTGENSTDSVVGDGTTQQAYPHTMCLQAFPSSIAVLSNLINQPVSMPLQYVEQRCED